MSTTATTPAAAPGAATTDDTGLRVLVADKFEESGLDAARAMGCAVESNPDLTPETLGAALADHDPDVLIVRSTKVPRAVIEGAGRLSLIIRAGAGYDNIDVAAASERGVFVANCPGKNALAVAELAWGLILCCDRRLPDQTRDLRAGTWDKKGYGKARGLYGRTLGLVGLGRIGTAVLERARGFGVDVIAWSRSLTPERARALGVTYCATPLEVAAGADIVSLHVAATPDTTNLVDDAFCDAMREGAYLINTSRGAVVDSAALTRVIRSKGIRAGLDVWGQQPAPGDSEFGDPIINESLVFGTHHCGASTDQAQQAIADESLRILDEYARHGHVPNCVNRAAASPATSLLTVRHLNRPGVLSHVFHVLSDGGINVEEMENIIYEGAEAACARIKLDSAPTSGQVDLMRKNVHVLSAELTRVKRDKS